MFSSSSSSILKDRSAADIPSTAQRPLPLARQVQGAALLSEAIRAHWLGFEEEKTPIVQSKQKEACTVLQV